MRIVLQEVPAENVIVAGEIGKRMARVDVALIEGRDEAKKAALIAALNQAVCASIDISGEDVRVLIRDVPKTDMGVANGISAGRRSLKRPPRRALRACPLPPRAAPLGRPGGGAAVLAKDGIHPIRAAHAARACCPPRGLPRLGAARRRGGRLRGRPWPSRAAHCILRACCLVGAGDQSSFTLAAFTTSPQREISLLM